MNQDDQEMFMIIILAVGLLYANQRGLLKPYIEKLKTLMGGAGGGVAPIVGGSGGISPGGTCPGGTSCGPCRPQSGGQRCECNNYNGASYEATFCGTWSGDDLSIKMWGPEHHDSSDCCWCILNTSPEGEMQMRGEGPHPDTEDIEGASGSVGGKPTCVKATITPGPKGAHVEGYGLVGGTWKKGITYDGPCGLNKKSTTPAAGQQISFRVDGEMAMKCATVKPLGGTPAAAYARTMIPLVDRVAI